MKLSCSEMMKVKNTLVEYDRVAIDSRGLALMWKKDTGVSLRSMSLHHIDVVIRLRRGQMEGHRVLCLAIGS